MSCEVIPTSSLKEPELEAWRQLSASAISPNPFAEPQFVLPAMRVWGVSDVCLLVVREGPRWRAALPVRQVRAHRGVPGSALAGWRHTYCYLGTPLVAPTDVEPVLECLIGGGVQAGGSLALDWVDADGPLAAPLTEALASVSRPVVVEQFDRAVLQRHAHNDYLEVALSSRHRSEYRRRRRRLEQEVGPLALRDDSHDPAAYQRFLSLERSSWKGSAGTALATRGHGAWFTEVCSAFAGLGRLLLISLASEDRTVAMLCDLVAGDTSYGFKITFDERLRRFGPGMQLLLDYVDHFHAGPLARMDSCAEVRNPTLNRLLADRRRLRTVVATARGPAGAVAYAKWLAAAAALPARRRLTGATQGADLGRRITSARSSPVSFSLRAGAASEPGRARRHGRPAAAGL